MCLVTTHHSLSCEEIKNNDLNNETTSTGSQSWDVLNHPRRIRRKVSQIEFRNKACRCRHTLFFCFSSLQECLSDSSGCYMNVERINHSVSCGKRKKICLCHWEGFSKDFSVHYAVFYLAFEVKEILEETLWHQNYWSHVTVCFAVPSIWVL